MAKIIMFTKKEKKGFELEKMHKYWALFNYRTADDVEQIIRDSDVEEFVKYWKRYYPVIEKEE